jgi:hypothetical protein
VRPRLSILGSILPGKPSVAVLRNQFCRNRRQRIFSKEINQRSGSLSFSNLSQWPLSRRHIGKIPLHGNLERHPLRRPALDEQAAHHFIFRPTRPVVGIFFQPECLDCRWPASLADDRFPSA